MAMLMGGAEIALEHAELALQRQRLHDLLATDEDEVDVGAAR
jgi:hypothetical protein